jgi:succinate-acetate transporter protein
MAEVSAQRAAATTANPAPLGLSAFALTTFVLSAANAGLFTGASIVIGLAIFYGGIVQVLAGMWEFKSGNTFGAAAFSSYGGFWLALGFILLPGSGIVASFIPKGATVPGPEFHTALGFFLLGWTIFTALMFIGTLRSNVALIVVFGLLTITFLLLALGEFGAGTGVLGGWFGIATALAAWYTALAGVLAAGPAMFSLPVGPRS